MKISPLVLNVSAIAISIFATVGVVTVLRAKPTSNLSLTPNEFIAIRTAQVQVLQAQQALSKAKEWNDLQSAQAELNKAVALVISTRKLDPAVFKLCDGPVTDPNIDANVRAACNGLTQGELAIRALPKPSTPVGK